MSDAQDTEVEEILQDFTCPLSKVESLEAWFSAEESEEECRPCTLPALASLYVGELEACGHEDLAKELQNTFEQGDILTIAKTMDRIKADVEEPVKRNLEKLDCFSQTFTEEMQDST